MLLQRGMGTATAMHSERCRMRRNGSSTHSQISRQVSKGPPMYNNRWKRRGM